MKNHRKKGYDYNNYQNYRKTNKVRLYLQNLSQIEKKAYKENSTTKINNLLPCDVEEKFLTESAIDNFKHGKTTIIKYNDIFKEVDLGKLHSNNSLINSNSDIKDSDKDEFHFLKKFTLSNKKFIHNKIIISKFNLDEDSNSGSVIVELDDLNISDNNVSTTNNNTNNNMSNCNNISIKESKKINHNKKAENKNFSFNTSLKDDNNNSSINFISNNFLRDKKSWLLTAEEREKEFTKKNIDILHKISCKLKSKPVVELEFQQNTKNFSQAIELGYLGKILEENIKKEKEDKQQKDKKPFDYKYNCIMRKSSYDKAATPQTQTTPKKPVKLNSDVINITNRAPLLRYPTSDQKNISPFKKNVLKEDKNLRKCPFSLNKDANTNTSNSERKIEKIDLFNQVNSNKKAPMSKEKKIKIPKPSNSNNSLNNFSNNINNQNLSKEKKHSLNIDHNPLFKSSINNLMNNQTNNQMNNQINNQNINISNINHINHNHNSNRNKNHITNISNHPHNHHKHEKESKISSNANLKKVHDPIMKIPEKTTIDIRKNDNKTNIVKNEKYFNKAISNKNIKKTINFNDFNYMNKISNHDLYDEYLISPVNKVDSNDNNVFLSENEKYGSKGEFYSKNSLNNDFTDKHSIFEKYLFDSKNNEFYSNTNTFSNVTNKQSMDSNKMREGSSDNSQSLIFDIEKEDLTPQDLLRISNISKMAKEYTSIDTYNDYQSLINSKLLEQNNPILELPSKDVSINSNNTFRSVSENKSDNSRFSNSNYISNNTASIITNKSSSFEFDKPKEGSGSIKADNDNDTLSK